GVPTAGNPRAACDGPAGLAHAATGSGTPSSATAPDPGSRPCPTRTRSAPDPTADDHGASDTPPPPPRARPAPDPPPAGSTGHPTQLTRPPDTPAATHAHSGGTPRTGTPPP